MSDPHIYHPWKNKRRRQAGLAAGRPGPSILTCAALLFGAVSLLVLALALPTRGSGASNPSPWQDDSKPVASFLFTNDDVLNRLTSDLGLTNTQTVAVREAGRKEAETLAALKGQSEAIVERTDIDTAAKQQAVRDMDYNGKLQEAVRASRISIEAVLTPGQLAQLPDWAAGEMQSQKQQFETAAITAAEGATTAGGGYRVYATQYYSNFGPDSVDVAVPDKSVKFASLGWEYDSGYPAGGNYTVNMSYNGHQLNNVQVKDCGPWNIDDNYWNGTGGSRPRRLYRDLPTGLPESQAAYFNDYNGGLDQFGRVVSNPAGIDLSPQAGVNLGLGYLVSGWITVNFNWEGATGYPVYGAILYRYNQLGGAPGQPLNAEHDVPGGRAQDFQVGRLIWNRTTGRVFWIIGAIMGKYDVMGGSGGPMGLPQGDEYGVPGGRANDFQHGRIFWSSATGAAAVFGAIGAKYTQLGGPAIVGLPLGDEHDAPGGARVSDFQNGSIYWSPAAGTFWVMGAIGAKYQALGGPAVLGLPASDEYPVPAVSSGRAANFQRGRIFWSPASGAAAAYGAILAKYNQLGGALGVAVSDEADVPGVPGARMSRFSAGNVYWSPNTGTFAAYGGILGKYLTLGGAATLGLPLADEADAPGQPGARVSVFERSRIYWSSQIGSYAVFGGIMGQYLSMGGSQSPLGLPVSDEYGVPGGRRSDFQGGSITWEAQTGRMSVAAPGSP